MKTSIKLLANALFLTVSLSLSTFASADDLPQKKAFSTAVFPANDASKLWVCLEHHQSENNVLLELLNEQGKVLFSEIVPKKTRKHQSYRQQFDISDLKDGNYTFRISGGSQREEIPFKLSTPAVEAPNRFVAIK